MAEIAYARDQIYRYLTGPYENPNAAELARLADSIEAKVLPLQRNDLPVDDLITIKATDKVVAISPMWVKIPPSPSNVTLISPYAVGPTYEDAMANLLSDLRMPGVKIVINSGDNQSVDQILKR